MNVLDASAVLAKLRKETGHDRIVFAGNVLSLVNFAEVATVLVRDGMDVSELKEELSNLGLELKAMTPEVALSAAQLYPVTKAKGLSLGDRVCLALAKSLGVAAVTTEKVWDEIEHGVEVERVR